MKKPFIFPLILVMTSTLPALADTSPNRNENGNRSNHKSVTLPTPKNAPNRSVGDPVRSYRPASPRAGNGGGNYGHYSGAHSNPVNPGQANRTPLPRYNHGGTNDNRNGGNGSNNGYSKRNGSNNPVYAYKPSRSDPRQWKRTGTNGAPHMVSHQLLPGTLRHGAPKIPSHGPGGGSLVTRKLPSRGMDSIPVRNQMSLIAGSPNFSRLANTYNATESRPGQYYWHTWDEQSFCHYSDRFGANWYGWPCNGGFLWTQYYSGNWWCYDPIQANWCYWKSGNWCWQDPNTQAVFLYHDGNYVPADGSNNGGTYADNYQAPVRSTGSVPPGEPDSGEDTVVTNRPYVFKSPDGTRMVQVAKDTGDAFLYQEVGGEDTKPVYLASNVSNVRYSQKNGVLHILVLMDDGNFQVFDGEGTPIDDGKPSNTVPQNDPADGLDS